MDTLVPLLPQPVTMEKNKQARIPLTTFNCDLKLASKPVLRCVKTSSPPTSLLSEIYAYGLNCEDNV